MRDKQQDSKIHHCKNEANVTMTHEGVVTLRLGVSVALPSNFESMIEANDTRIYSMFSLQLLGQVQDSNADK